MIRNLYDTTSRDQRSVNSELSRSPITDYRSRHKAFTLIELLVVITIIATLAAILFPVFAQAKQAAKKTTCLSNLKQITTASLLYVNDYDDRWPKQWSKLISPTVGVSYNVLFTNTYDYTTGIQTYSGGLLDAYLKAFQLTGCPSAIDMLYWENYVNDRSKGVLSIARNVNYLTDALNMSDVQEPGNTVFFGDAGTYRTPLGGYATEGVYAYYAFAQRSYNCFIHGRHNGKVATSWGDGHVKIMPLTYRDVECDPSYEVPLGIVKSKLDANKLGWLLPPGLTPTTSTSEVTWATSVWNDIHRDNYLNLKKIP